MFHFSDPDGNSLVYLQDDDPQNGDRQNDDRRENHPQQA